MNAPLVRLDGVVAYASDAVIPDSDVPELITHHEAQYHKDLEKVASLVGGNAYGELATYNGGELIDESQFELD